MYVSDRDVLSFPFEPNRTLVIKVSSIFTKISSISVYSGIYICVCVCVCVCVFMPMWSVIGGVTSLMMQHCPLLTSEMPADNWDWFSFCPKKGEL